MKVAAIAMHSEMGAVDENLARVEEWTHEARLQGAGFALFTEECITGSLNKTDLTLDEAREIARYAAEKSAPFLEALCRAVQMTVVVGTIEPAGERLGNHVLIVGPEGHLATIGKLHLPNANERAWFAPGESLPVVTSQGWTFSAGICYDIRFPEIFRAAARAGAEFFLLAVGGSGGVERVDENGDQRAQALYHRKLALQLMPARAVDNGLYVFYANQAGKSGNVWFPGLCLAVDPQGEILAEHLPDEGMIVVEVSKKVIANARSGISRTVARVRPEIYDSPRIVSEEGLPMTAESYNEGRKPHAP